MRRLIIFLLIFSFGFSGSVFADFAKGMKAVDSGDFKTALREFQSSAQAGHVDSAYELGNLYFYNKIGSVNSTSALQWYLKAAEKGHLDAQNKVGFIYRHGKGVKRNFAAAAKWWRQAADKQFSKSQRNLGTLFEAGAGVPKDYSKALQLYKLAAQNGYFNAYNNIGNMYAGGRGVNKDFTSAVKWWQQGADKGDGPAQYNLGRAFEYGRGVSKDYIKAAKWYRRSADQGFYFPMFRLGTLLERGLGVPKNIGLAIKWYNAAIKRGNYAPAFFRLGEIAATGIESKRNLKVARKYYERAAKQGHKMAKARLANFNNFRSSAKPIKKYPVLVKPTSPREVYKGITLIGSYYAGAKNSKFFQVLKLAIDKTETIPEALKRNVKLIKEIIYNPPSKERQRNDAYTNVVGVYTIGKNFNRRAPVVIYKDMRFSSPSQVGLSLIGNGLLAKRHNRMIELRKILRSTKSKKGAVAQSEYKRHQQEYARLVAGLEKTDNDVVNEYKCESLRTTFIVYKAWKFDAKRKDRLAREISKRKCWGKSKR